VSVNYRLLPKTDPLLQAEDVTRALAEAQSKATTWGGDPAKFILMGHSAGAHLVSLISASPAKAKALGAQPWLGTVSLDSAALDVVQIMNRDHFRLYDQAFGKDTNYWKSVSPIHVLSAEAKPMLLVCSSTRADKPCDQARALAARAGELGVRVEITQQAKSHKEINQQLGLAGSYTDAVEKFMGSLDVAARDRLAVPVH
jgi:acetyl esterase/lipase